MKFFSKPQSFMACVAKSKSCMIKTGTDKKPGICVTMRIPLFDGMLEEMPDRVRILLAAGTEKIQEALLLGKMDADFSLKVSVNILSAIDRQVLVSRGFNKTNPLILKVKKFYNIGSVPTMEIELVGLYDDTTWMWLGKSIGDGDCRIEVVPFEENLFKDSEEGKAEAKAAAERANRN